MQSTSRQAFKTNTLQLDVWFNLTFLFRVLGSHHSAQTWQMSHLTSMWVHPRRSRYPWCTLMATTAITGKEKLFFFIVRYLLAYAIPLFLNRCETAKAGMLEMPYQGGDMSMIFILPFEGTPLSQVEMALKNFSWTKFYERANMVSTQQYLDNTLVLMLLEQYDYL